MKLNYLALVEENDEIKEVKQGENLFDNNHSAGIKNENFPVQDKGENSSLQSFRPKWKH